MFPFRQASREAEASQPEAPPPSTDDRKCSECDRLYMWLLNEKIRCERCGRSACAGCVKMMHLLCHEAGDKDVPVCLRCQPEAQIENRWHAYSLPHLKNDQSLETLMRCQGLSGNVLTAFGCVCGSQHVLKESVLNFSGMSKHRMLQDRAAAYLLTMGCKALALADAKESPRNGQAENGAIGSEEISSIVHLAENP